jgi:hypothetical protein
LHKSHGIQKEDFPYEEGDGDALKKEIEQIKNDRVGVYDVFSVIDGTAAGLLPSDETVPIDVAIEARSYALDAAENGKVVAIIEPE